MSLSFVGKKFIDKDNNRFSIRFNRDTRKMEIVKILIRQGGKMQEEVGLRNWEVGKEINTKSIEKDKSDTNDSINTSEELISDESKSEEVKSEPNTHKTNVSDSNQNQNLNPNSKPNPVSQSSKSAINKNSDWNFSGYDLDISSEESTGNDNDLNPDNKPDPQSISKEEVKEKEGYKWKNKDERDMIDNFMKRIEETKQRISSVLINIKSSRIFEVTGDPSENQNIMGNLTREFDVEVFQGLDEISNYLKELTSYPRAVSYYAAKFEKSKKPELSKAESEKEKLHLIVRWEMQESFSKISQKTKALTLSLLNVLNLKNENHIKQLQYQNQLMFTDAKNATIFCSQDIDKLIQEIENWKYNTMVTNHVTQ
ncbi:MAG: hypothetical protein JJT78_08160 [Leptospira sp.]|nr:hypothetical protein [Leptospira sp.]